MAKTAPRTVEEKWEKPYEYEAFPKMVFNRNLKGELVDRVVHDPDELAEAGKKGWKESPADLPKPDDDAPQSPEELLAELAELRRQNAELLEIAESKVAGAGAKGKGKKDKDE